MAFSFLLPKKLLGLKKLDSNTFSSNMINEYPTIYMRMEISLLEYWIITTKFEVFDYWGEFIQSSNVVSGH